MTRQFLLLGWRRRASGAVLAAETQSGRNIRRFPAITVSVRVGECGLLEGRRDSVLIRSHSRIIVTSGLAQAYLQPKRPDQRGQRGV